MQASPTKLLLLQESNRAACAMLAKVNLGTVNPDPTGADPTVQLLVKMWRSLQTDAYAQLEAEDLDTTVFTDPAGTTQPAAAQPLGAQAVGGLTQAALIAALQALPAGSLASLLGQLNITGTAAPAGTIVPSVGGAAAAAGS